MKEILRQKYITMIFSLLGIVGGFLYWKFVGCLSGTCPIQSVWYWSTLWGAGIGFLVGDFINDMALKRKTEKKDK